jgi:hypothetical protein
MSKIEVDAIEPQSGTTLTIGASGDAVNIASGATITDFTSTGIDDNATSNAITIESTERVQFTRPRSNTLGDSALEIKPSDTVIGYGFRIDQATNSFIIEKSSPSASEAERMRIDSSGNVLVGKTSTSIDIAGSVIFASGNMELAKANNLLTVNRLTTDGQLIVMAQAGVQEGNISVSGSTVSYNGFTGTHWSRFIDNSTPTILRGTVLESLDEMCDWYNLEFDITTQDNDGNDVTNTKKIPHILAEGQSVGDVITYNHEGTDVQATIVKEADVKHVKSKVSDTVDAKNVYGVFSAYDLDGEGYNDFYVASVGSFVVRIKQGETVAKGDLLQSNGDGTAKVQTDDAVRSSSFAKVLSTTVIKTYEDGSFLVPCSLMC